MKRDRKTTVNRAGGIAVLVLVFLASYVLLDRSEHRPDWLSVEAPQVAFIGGSFEIRATLEDAVRATRIVCTLHRAGSDRRLREHVASSGPVRDVARGGTYSFLFDIPEKENLSFVSAVIYLSPTGSWQDRTLAAHTKLIPVKKGATAGEVRALIKTRVYPSASAADDAAAERAARRPGRGPSPWAHPILFVILLASAMLCLAKAGRKRPEALPEETRDRAVWLAFAAVLALCAFLELSGLVGHLSAWGRRLAMEANLYDLRKPYQKAIMAVVAAGALGLFLLFIRAMKKPGTPHHLWWAGIGLAAYLSVSFVNVLSFHAVDVARGMTWHGISPVDAARGAGTVVSLIAAAIALRSRKAS